MSHAIGRHNVFKRLERDAELKERVRAAGGSPMGMFDEELDTYAWDRCRLQRRIIEDRS